MSTFIDYELPPELIAQEPIEPRDASRLLVLDRAGDTLSHRHFRDLPDLLRKDDLLVLNDTRVLPARLIGVRSKTGGRWEGLFLRELDGRWEMLAQTRGWVEVGETIDIGSLRLALRDRTSDRHWLMEPLTTRPTIELLSEFGQMPLPPYIRKGQARPDDTDRYQTVFADRPGAVAAPTAGLHFTADLLQQLTTMGVQRASVTLHVGLGTFEPMRTLDVEKHVMHHEWCEVPLSTVEAVTACRQRGGRVVAVGTTAVRSLETASQSGTLQPWSGETNLFIYPPYEFRSVDALITNFHLPQTTLLFLVSAFAGVERLRHAYDMAIRERYRFYSYGDAMLIV